MAGGISEAPFKKQEKEATFLSVDGCSEKASAFSMPGYQLKPSDGRKRNMLYQRAQRNGGKIECHIDRCEGTRFQNCSIQFCLL